jgi:mannose-6-phosphate isomerase-like protein (cupin superfamily)
MVILSLFLILGYLIIGLLIHHWVFPYKTPDYKSYFKVGTSFHSKLEGLSQTVVKVENGKLVCDISLQPNSLGPVLHLHEKFDESFTVKNGKLSMQYGSTIKSLTAGESIVIPKNMPHKPFNETDSIVLVTSEMPLEFAYCLSQIYPFWDENESNTKPPKILFQLAVFGENFDSFPTIDAPPKNILKWMKFILAPTARLMGYKFYNQAYQPK